MRARLITADSVRTARGVAGDTILVRDGAIADVGPRERFAGTDLHEDRYPGSVVVPGLRDAHFHPVTYAAVMSGVGLRGAADFSDVAELLGEAARSLAPGVPLVAMRLDDAALAEGRLPDRRDLDRWFPDRPVLLHRYCGHIAVANGAALDLAGIAADTADPAGGSLDRDGSGRPTGVLRETAVELVSGPLAAAGPAPVDPEGLARAMQALPGVGITSIGAIAGCGDGAWADLGDQVGLLAAAAAEIPIRLNVLAIAATPGELERAALVVERSGCRFLGLKAFADGSLGGHTAAMHGPFADRPGETGMLRLDPARNWEMAKAALGLGGMVAVHAIGDRANARVLGLFEDLVDEGTDPARLRVEHASVLGENEVHRFVRTGVTASVQPAFLPSETGWLEDRLGPERMRHAYPFRTLHEAGVPLAGGSDCPVEPPHPLWGMAAARDRAGIVPEEGLDPADALALFTDWAAAALEEPAPLAVGSPADFVVLDVDPVEASPAELRRARVLATWIGGAPVAMPDRPVWTG